MTCGHGERGRLLIAQATAIAVALCCFAGSVHETTAAPSARAADASAPLSPLVKVPVQEDGVWTQVPRYTFDSTTFDITN